jgi:hypothetical protein
MKASLHWKYALAFGALVSLALAINQMISAFFVYQQSATSLLATQQETSNAIAEKIERHFIDLNLQMSRVSETLAGEDLLANLLEDIQRLRQIPEFTEITLLAHAALPFNGRPTVVPAIS